MKSILVATDFSVPAENAVSYAAQLAYRMRAELIIFNVYKPSIHVRNSLSSSISMDNIKKNNETKLSELADKVANDYGIKVSWDMEQNETVDSLKSFTENNPIDLVVMGIERNLTEYKMFGNTTTAVIKLMQFPVLVIPNDIHFSSIQNIMFACKSSYIESENELNLLKKFIKTFNAKLNVFHVLKLYDKGSNTEMEEKMDEMLQGIDYKFTYIKDDSVANGIKEGIEQNSPDLLVMIPHKLSFFESIFTGSRTTEMTVDTKVPLLVIPSKIH